MSFATDDIAWMKIIYIRPDLDDLPRKLVSDHHRNRDCFLSPFIPVVDVQIGSANACAPDPYQNIVYAGDWLRDIFQPQSWLALAFD